MLMSPLTRRAEVKLRRACRHRRRSAALPVFTVRSRDERLEGSSFPVGSIAAQLPSPTTDRIPLSVASERTGWTADRVLYRGRTVVLKVRVSPDLIAGDVDEGYGKVADVFRRNMTIGQEVGPPKVISLSRNYSRPPSPAASRAEFEALAQRRIDLVGSASSRVWDLTNHPVHRAARIFGWEIKSRPLVPQGQDR